MNEDDENKGSILFWIIIIFGGLLLLSLVIWILFFELPWQWTFFILLFIVPGAIAYFLTRKE